MMILYTKTIKISISYDEKKKIKDLAALIRREERHIVIIER